MTNNLQPCSRATKNMKTEHWHCFWTGVSVRILFTRLNGLDCLIRCFPCRLLVQKCVQWLRWINVKWPSHTRANPWGPYQQTRNLLQNMHNCNYSVFNFQLFALCIRVIFLETYEHQIEPVCFDFDHILTEADPAMWKRRGWSKRWKSKRVKIGAS